MTVRKLGRYAVLLIVVILAAGYFSCGEIATAYAQEISSINTFDVDSYYIGRNTRRLFGLIFVGVVIFGAVKGWRRGVVLGCFLTFLGLASFGLFTYGQMIASWLNSAESKLIPTVMFFAGGMLYISLLHKLYKMMNVFLKEHLYKK